MPAKQLVKPGIQLAMPTEQLVKPAKQLGKPGIQLAMPTEQFAKPAGQFAMPVEQSCPQIEKSKQKETRSIHI